MGIYSTEAAQIYRENIYNPDASGLLEFALESQRSEQAMFDTMLEMDFLEYKTESGEIFLTETEKNSGFAAAAKNIFDKAMELIEKAIESVTAFITRLGEFVLEKTKADKLFIKKYSKDFDINKAAKNDPGKEITVTNINAATKEIQDAIGKCKINELSEVWTIQGSSISGLSDSLDDIKKTVETIMKKNFLQTYKLGNPDFKKIAGEINSAITSGTGYKKLADEIIGSDADKILKKLKEVRKQAKPSLFEKRRKNGPATDEYSPAEGSKESKEEFQKRRAEGAEQYRYLNTVISSASKILNFGSRVALQAMANYRKAYVAIAIAASKETEAKPEANTSTSSNSTPENRPEDILQRQAREGQERARAYQTNKRINKAHSGYADTGATSYADFENESAIYTDILEFAIHFNTDNAFSVSFG